VLHATRYQKEIASERERERSNKRKKEKYTKSSRAAGKLIKVIIILAISFTPPTFRHKLFAYLNYEYTRQKFHSTAKAKAETESEAAAAAVVGAATIGAATKVCFLMLDAALQLRVYCVALLFI